MYGADRHRLLNDPLDKARETMKSRYYESARTIFRDALVAQPGNWAIMEEIASTFLMITEEYNAALAMSEQGLGHNPIAPGLWRAKGEALLALKRPEQARAAVEYLTGLAPSLAMSWLVLAELEYSEGNHCAALDAVATGLKHDKSGDDRTEFLKVQSNVLAAMEQQALQTITDGANRLRALDSLSE